MELNYFDLVVGIIVLLLGLKGILNGFFKELFGLIGIIGGIFVASRVGDQVGQMISDAVFHFDSQAAVAFTGFLVTLALFWAVMIMVGLLFKKMSNVSGLGPVDKILGFVFGSGKFFLIGSVIVYALFNIKTIRDNLEPAMENSIIFPIMVTTGNFIMHIDPVETVGDLNESVEETIEATKEKIEDTTTKINEAAEEAVIEKAEELVSDVKEQIENNITDKENIQ